jgi:hypothetical protein
MLISDLLFLILCNYLRAAIAHVTKAAEEDVHGWKHHTQCGLRLNIKQSQHKFSEYHPLFQWHADQQLPPERAYPNQSRLKLQNKPTRQAWSPCQYFTHNCVKHKAHSIMHTLAQKFRPLSKLAMSVITRKCDDGRITFRNKRNTNHLIHVAFQLTSSAIKGLIG